jgi:uncharacterized protein
MGYSNLYDAAVEAADAAKDTEEANAHAEYAARAFLTSTCPAFLEALDSTAASSADRLLKAGRNILATVEYAKASGSDDKMDKVNGALSLLVEECSAMAVILSNKETRKVPKVRYGKTELQMPIVSLGCMRFQQSWNRDGATNVSKIDQVDQDCQDNLYHILKYAVSMGVTHIETAQGYGSSELQLGYALERLFKEKHCKREDLIIQTKGGVAQNMTVANYKKQIVGQLQRLKLKYVDLFSVHGLNMESDLKYLFDNDPQNGNLIDALRELQAEGKIRHIGFSTHGRADLIRSAIETDAFAYVNMHHHCVGSYTTSGDSLPDGHHGNWANIELARSKDMGVFIISPYDKGGRLYAPSVRLRELTLPEFEPMEYGSLWLWQYHLHQKTSASSKGPMAHTLVCGAARPSDLDQPVLAAFKMIQHDGDAQKNTGILEKTIKVSDRLNKKMVAVLPGGQTWVDTWHVGVPNWYHAKYGTQHGNLVWLYNLIQAYGLLDFAKERYATLDPRSIKWESDKPKEENAAQYGPVWGWVPGCGVIPDRDYTADDFSQCPAENQEQLMHAITFVHKWCRPVKKEDEHQDDKLEIPYEWQTSYDMRPWTAFPERD